MKQHALSQGGPASQPANSASRRHFLKTSTAAAGLTLFGGLRTGRAANTPSETIRAAVMGLGRGMDLAQSSLALPNVEVAWLCDIDEQRLARGVKLLEPKQKRSPKTSQDIRQVLADKDLDVIFIAAPNHWHAPATILACAAGKHVYVEKPCSHNPWEGEMMVAAARKHQRVVQMGNQRRSWPAVIEAMEKLAGGAIGAVRFARSWYNGARGTIGRGKPAPIPANLDYSLWQGPAPERPYLDNLVHYNWHWRWHWGNGELGNNGIHALDLVRWGLRVTHPTRVTCNGGRYHFDDDQESPDTSVAHYDFGKTGATWDVSSCHPREQENHAFVTFYGDEGSLAIIAGGYKIYDLKGKETSAANGDGGEKVHIADFLSCVKSGARPRSDIEEGHLSTNLCHLGNIAWRVGRTLNIDPKTGRILNDPGAEALWKREYRPGWEPQLG